MYRSSGRQSETWMRANELVFAINALNAELCLKQIFSGLKVLPAKIRMKPLWQYLSILS